ncbi:SusC/RagA family TonB-linked outer membrane protein [Chitinophaga filiformis]|uniref:SusC/RagA family TonB-linked outer membrane protein n=1 Tax=Chitinophaga filiformis TaxID=104663 RepID=UPI001F3CE59C|nr:SusC/RagA family TonB-linked outer membrane protein [Chitinophaga filiformis]MCF6407456.1 SusC/RagA family TonB-linked outer membrane protein [Chitinophaga filiformis]MCF6407638.1 SusC/RagA family TonB-linked outer membrane protein [Chitinophaga filiformis]
MKRILSLFILLLSLNTWISAQDKAPGGKVLDAASGKPLPFVTITNTTNKGASIKGDADGQFPLPAAKAVLTFRFVGYKSQTVTFNPGQASLVIRMETEVSGLDEVVVIGYGQQKKKDITSAVSSVSGKEISELPATSINSALQARVPGVQISSAGYQPGAGTNIRIRGINSITQGDGPIYVVDGVILTGDIREINPYDIESIDVLKDASAAAIYGARAAAGVVIITTKKAKTGRASVDYNGYYGIQKIVKTYDFIDGAQYGYLRRLAWYDESATGWPMNDPETDRKIFSAVELKSLAEGKTYDWPGAITQVAQQQSHTLSISNGIGKNKVYLSGNYLNQDGIIKGSNMKRYALKANLETAVTDKLTVGLNTNYSHIQTSIVSNEAYYAAVTMSPLRPIYDSTGKPTIEIDPSTGNLTSNNPLSLALDATNRRIDDRLIGNMYLDYKLLPGLSFRSNVGADIYKNQQFEYYPRNTSAGYLQKGVAKVQNFGYRDWLWENTMTYDYNPSEEHSLNLLSGFTFQKRRQEWNFEQASGFPTDALTYKNMNLATRRDYISSDYFNWATSSLLGRAIYKYKQRYILNFTARYDGSSRFGAANRYGFFPSISGAWRLIDEPFLGVKFKSRVSDAKIRVSYGIIGNQDVSYDKIFSQMNAATYPLNGSTQSSGYQLGGNKGNSALKWESQHQFNTGFDLALLNNRIQMTFDFYNKDIKNLLLQNTLAPSQGFDATMINVASMNTRGIDIGLKLYPVKMPNFDWQIDLNWSKYKSKVTALLPGRDSLSPYLKVGEAPNSLIVDYVFDGIYNKGDDFKLNPTGRPGDVRIKDLNNDGIINQYDRAIVGRTTPKAWGGIWNYFRYKRVSMTVFASYMYGHDIYNKAYMDYVYSDGRKVILKDGLNYWTPENTNTNIPRPNAFGSSTRTLPQGSSSFAVQKGDFLRIRNITLAYDFSPTLLSKLKIKSLNVYAQALEPFLFTGYKGTDPEIGVAQGAYDIYPRFRTYLLGLKMGL